MYVEVGRGISPNFQQVLELLFTKGEYLAFAPDTMETEQMIDIMSIKFPLLKVPLCYINASGFMNSFSFLNKYKKSNVTI